MVKSFDIMIQGPGDAWEMNDSAGAWRLDALACAGRDIRFGV